MTEFLADYWIWGLGIGAFVIGRALGIGSNRNSGEVGGTGVFDWFDGDGDGGD
ncbi:MAG: hypothetical protein AAGM21_09795 [Pseudomonadota bacterium]